MNTPQQSIPVNETRQAAHALLDTKEAADYLRIRPQTLEVWRCHGGGPAFVKLGRRVVYRLESLERFIVDNEHTSTSAREGGAA